MKKLTVKQARLLCKWEADNDFMRALPSHWFNHVYDILRDYRNRGSATYTPTQANILNSIRTKWLNPKKN